MRPLPRFLCLTLAPAVLAGSAFAAPVDGKFEASYGASLSTQTTQTSRGDGFDFFASELDEAFGYVAADTLFLLIGGSFNRFQSEPIIAPNQLQLYLDTGPGGQNPLSGSNPDIGMNVKLPMMSGLQFDDDFTPDYWFAAERASFNGLFVHFAELPAGGGGSGSYLGFSTIGGPPILAGGSNPIGVLASVDISNSAGVTAGCDASSGAGVLSGIEMAIPLAAIGNPSGPIRVCALLAYYRAGGEVANQVLGPVPPGTCALGPASGVDFGNLAGAQYFVVGGITEAARTSWGRLKARYR